MSDDLEHRLRRALAEHADRIEPSGDGLRRIRARTARDRFRWRLPVLALAGAAALVAALLLVPSMLPTLQPSQSDAPAASAPVSPPPAGSTTIPGAGVTDLRTVWPYPTRREGYERGDRDLAAGRYGDLTRADLVAVRFVGSYVRADGLTAVSAGPWQAGIRMQVRRAGEPVSLVYLVRTRVGNDAPYVVAEATAPGLLTVSARPGPDGAVHAEGTRADPAAVPYVQLRVPGTDVPLAAARPPAGDPEWDVQLAPPSPRLPAGAVAAWTQDAAGDVTAFAATPVAP